jgi:multicomponent Na+:H+ antiporter subunit D
MAQPPVFNLPLPLAAYGVDPFGALLIYLSLIVFLLVVLLSAGAPGWGQFLVLSFLLLVFALPLYVFDNVAVFWLAWELAALMCWAIGQNAQGDSREDTGVLPIQLAGGIGSVMVAACLFILVSGSGTFSLLALRPEAAPWAGPVLLVGILLKSLALAGYAWRGGRQPLAGASAAMLMTAGLYVIGIFPLSKLLIGVYGANANVQLIVGMLNLGLDWRELCRWLGLIGAAVLALAALGEDDIRRSTAYVALVQVLLLFAGLALTSAQGIAGSLLVLIGYTFASTALFVSVATAEQRAGERSLAKLGGLGAVAPGSAAVFVVSGLALAGLPPLGPAVGQVMVVTSLLGLRAVLPMVLYGAAFLLTLLSILRLFRGLYLGPVALAAVHSAEERPSRLATLTMLPLLVAVALAGLAPFWAMGVIEQVVTYFQR